MLNEAIYQSLVLGGVGRLPHALLLIGAPGVGCPEFGETLASFLLCESPLSSSVACGKCQGCHWLATQNHPDFRRVAPEADEETEEPTAEKSKKKSLVIKIGQIRALEEFVFVGSHRNGNRVILISDANAMTTDAANSLLKILEEPPASLYFILISSNHRSLLPTLRSRCRVINFGAPDRAESLAWMTQAGITGNHERYLDFAGGAPAQVLKWQEQGVLATIDSVVGSMSKPPADPIALAGIWNTLLKTDSPFRLEHLVDSVQRWLFDLAQESTTGEVRYHRGWPRANSNTRINTGTLLAAWREVAQLRRSAKHPLNQLLFLETLAAYFLKATRPSGA